MLKGGTSRTAAPLVTDAGAGAAKLQAILSGKEVSAQNAAAAEATPPPHWTTREQRQRQLDEAKQAPARAELDKIMKGARTGRATPLRCSASASS